MIEKYEFTYADYVLLTQKNYFGIEEKLLENEDKNKITQKHDKSFKKALEDPEEMSNFLSNFLNIKVDDKKLKIYGAEHITEQYEVRLSDIVYKKEGEEIYYIIEHQSTVDLNMPYRMLRYCMELMRKIIENSNQKIYPTIVPIVIYTGERKWSVAKNFADKQELSKEEYEEYKIDMKYKLIDISQISREELLIKQTYIASIMLIEKSTNKDEMVTNIKKIIENTKDIKQLMKLKNYIIFIQKDILQGEEVELLEMISGKVGNDQMSTLIERLKRENDAIRKEAREQAIKELKGTVEKQVRKEVEEEVRGKVEEEVRGKVEEEVRGKIKEKVLNLIVKMLQNQETDEKIKMYTDATDEQIEQGKRQLGIIV